MKKRRLGAGLAALLMFVTMSGCSQKLNKIEIGEDDIYIVFAYNEVAVNQVLSAEDAKEVREILNNKALTEDTPDSTFSNRIAIKSGKTITALQETAPA